MSVAGLCRYRDDELLGRACRYRRLWARDSGNGHGAITELRPGDVFHIAPGHDSWVVGDEIFFGKDRLRDVEEMILATR